LKSRHASAAQDGEVLLEGFGSNGVFDEEWGKALNLIAISDGIWQVEALVKV
jgi:hypothetical protein